MKRRIMRPAQHILLTIGLGCLVPWFGPAGPYVQDGQTPTIRQTWERCQETLIPFSYKILKDEVVVSDTDPAKKLRRLEVRFTSQTVGLWDHLMIHTGVIYMPADPAVLADPSYRGKVVIIANAFGDTSMIDNYGEPIAARTGYPTMVVPIPGEYDGHDGESSWVYFLRAQIADTNDPIEHQYFRFAIPYLTAIDIFSAILNEPRIRAVIGGHSKRAPAAFNAAAMDPKRVAGVIYMGMESTFASYEGRAWQSISPVHSQEFVKCPVLYLGATNEDGYEMFNITRLESKMHPPWTVEVIPNYRHATASEVQILDWQMWISHVFQGRPVTRISDLRFEETEQGTIFRAKIDSPNKLILTKAWYVYNDDPPYWRDLMWYPVYLQKAGDIYEAFLPGKLPDAWFVEVKDIAQGVAGYVSSPPQDITHEETKERVSRGWRSRNWEPKPRPKKSRRK
jgi:pimeloyl-ACP methyl ester carboxylesterase